MALHTNIGLQCRVKKSTHSSHKEHGDGGLFQELLQYDCKNLLGIHRLLLETQVGGCRGQWTDTIQLSL